MIVPSNRLRLLFSFLFSGLFLTGFALKQDANIQYVVHVVVNPELNYSQVWESFDQKPEISIISWDALQGIAVLETVPQIQPEMLQKWLAEFKVKVLQIQRVQ